MTSNLILSQFLVIAEQVLQGQYEAAAKFCIQRCINRWDYTSYLENHVDLLFLDDITFNRSVAESKVENNTAVAASSSPVPVVIPEHMGTETERIAKAAHAYMSPYKMSSPNVGSPDQVREVFACREGLYDACALHFILCLVAIEQEASEPFKRLYQQYFTSDARVSTLFLILACRNANYHICRHILTSSTNPLAQSNQAISCRALPSHEWILWTPFTALHSLKDNLMMRSAINYLLQAHGFHDIGASEPFTLLCRYGERVAFRREHAGIIKPFKAYMEEHGFVMDVSDLLSASTAIAIRTYIDCHIQRAYGAVWNPEVELTYTNACELSHCLVSWDETDAWPTPLMVAAYAIHAIRFQSCIPSHGLDSIVDGAIAPDVADAFVSKFGEQWQYGAYSYLKEITMGVLTDLTLASLLRTLSLDELMLGIINYDDPNDQPYCSLLLAILHFGFYCNKKCMNAWDTSSILLHAVKIIMTSRECKPIARAQVLGFVIHWIMMRFYDENPLQQLLVATAGRRAIDPNDVTVLFHDVLPSITDDPNASPLTIDERIDQSTKLIPKAFVDLFAELGDEDWLAIFQYLKAEANNECVRHVVFESSLSPTSNNILHMLFKLGFVSAGALVFRWSQEVFDDYTDHLRFISQLNVLGERPVHLLAAAHTNMTSTSTSEFGAALAETVIAVGVSREAFCSSQTARGNLMHYTCLSMDRTKIRLVLPEMDASSRDALWSGQSTYETLVLANLNPIDVDNRVVLTHLIQSFVQGRDEQDFVDEYDCMSVDDSNDSFVGSESGDELITSDHE
jgi:hypothetical protein